MCVNILSFEYVLFNLHFCIVLYCIFNLPDFLIHMFYLFILILFNVHFDTFSGAVKYLTPNDAMHMLNDQEYSIVA